MLDYSSTFGSIAQNGIPGTGFNGFGVTGAPLSTVYRTSNLSQEIRASIPIGESFEWLFGGFYSHLSTLGYQSLNASNATTGQVAGLLAYFNSEGGGFTTSAAFTDFTFHLTDRFDVQIGGRETHYRDTERQQTESGPLFGPTPVIAPSSETSNNAFTYLLTPRFKLSSDLMIYARFASGFRPGGANSPAAIARGAPSSYDPDKTQNYEIGLKGDFFNHVISVDASLYHVDWKDLQIARRLPSGFGYSGNGSEAKSEGVELSIVSKPLTGLTIGAWVDYDDAALTQPFPADSKLYGVAGNRLPLSSRWSGNVSVEQEFPLWSTATGFFAGEASYVGDRLGIFQNKDAPLRQNLPAYAKTDLRAGVRYDAWTASVYVNNVADVRGVLDGGIGYLFPFAYIDIQPRTVGLNLSRTF